MPNRYVFSAEEMSTWPDGHRKCTKCKELKAFSEFYKRNSGYKGFASSCKQCALPEQVARYRNSSTEERLYKSAKQRATKDDTPFTISVEDIEVPTHCPVLGIPLKHNEGTLGPDSPSLDKVIPELGYIPGNIAVLSHRANLIKDKYSYEELHAVVKWMEDFLRKEDSYDYNRRETDNGYR